MNIYVSNLNYKVDEGDLREIFEEYGEVTSVKIITDKDSGRSKGFGFVEMKENSEGKKAIDALNGAEVEGRKIIVNEARPRRTDNNRF